MTKGFVDGVCLERISVDGESLTSASCRLHVDRDRVSGVTLDGVLISEK